MNEEKLESGIFGNADVIFGGKIGATIGELKEEDFYVVLCLYELSKKYELGVIPTNEDFDREPEATLMFKDVKSIEIVQEWLEEAKQTLLQNTNGEKYISYSKDFQDVANTVIVDGFVVKSRNDEKINLIDEVINKNDLIIEKDRILYCFFKEETKYRVESIVNELFVRGRDCRDKVKFM